MLSAYSPKTTHSIVDRELSEKLQNAAVNDENQSALDGYKVCIFACGPTGSGKTYTMEGPSEMTEGSEGMIPRAVMQIFQCAKDLEEIGWEYDFTASFLEIYNETIQDLLGDKSNLKHEIKMLGSGSLDVIVTDLKLVPVKSEKQALLLEAQNKQLSATVAQKEQLTSVFSEEASQLERKLRAKEDELDSNCRKYQREIDEINRESKEKQDSTRQYSRELEDLNFRNSSLERQKESLESELKACREEITGLKSAVSKYTAAQAGLKSELEATQVIQRVERSDEELCPLVLEVTEKLHLKRRT